MRSAWVVSLLVGFSPFTHGVQVANLQVSKSVAAKYSCDAKCYKEFQAGLASDAAYYGALYDEDFYKTARNFSTSKPGDVLKFKIINPTSLSGIPAGTTAYRFQYVSKDIQGNKVPVTGFIAFPYASQTSGHKFRTIALAHGTSGVFKGCAPSAMPNLYEYGSWAYLVNRGYAVIATDYAGLGNNYTFHQYMASPAQANDLYYSVAAAQKLFSQYLTPEWMSVGHSQGGGAVWALAESSLLKSNPLYLGNYLGTLAQAPATRLKEMALLAIDSSSPSSTGASEAHGILSEVGWVVLGLQSTSPKDKLTWVKPAFKKRLELATIAQGCYASMEALVADLTFSDVFDLNDPSLLVTLDTLNKLTARGSSKSKGPVLVVQGLDDVSVLPEITELSAKAGCESGDEIHLQLYPGVNHDQVITVSAPFALQWVDDRFNRAKTSGKCTNQTVVPFDSASMYIPATV